MLLHNLPKLYVTRHTCSGLLNFPWQGEYLRNEYGLCSCNASWNDESIANFVSHSTVGFIWTLSTRKIQLDILSIVWLKPPQGLQK